MEQTLGHQQGSGAVPAPVGGNSGEFILVNEQQWRQPAVGNTSPGGLNLTRQHAIKSMAGQT